MRISFLALSVAVASALGVESKIERLVNVRLGGDKLNFEAGRQTKRSLLFLG